MKLGLFFLHGTALSADAGRFVAAGIVNTILTLLLYQVLVFRCSAQTSYLLAWLIGFLLVISFYPKRVFVDGRKGFLSRLVFGATYGAILLLGMVLLSILEYLGLGARLPIFIVVPVTTLANFSLGRLIFRPT